MTPEEHHAEAERLVDMVIGASDTNPNVSGTIAVAHVHAVLATTPPDFRVPNGRALAEWASALDLAQRIDAIDTTDPEAAHAAADAYLLAAAPIEVAAAYRRLVARAPWWATA